MGILNIFISSSKLNVGNAQVNSVSYGINIGPSPAKIFDSTYIIGMSQDPYEFGFEKCIRAVNDMKIDTDEDTIEFVEIITDNEKASKSLEIKCSLYYHEPTTEEDYEKYIADPLFRVIRDSDFLRNNGDCTLSSLSFNLKDINSEDNDTNRCREDYLMELVTLIDLKNKSKKILRDNFPDAITIE